MIWYSESSLQDECNIQMLNHYLAVALCVVGSITRLGGEQMK